MKKEELIELINNDCLYSLCDVKILSYTNAMNIAYNNGQYVIELKTE